MTNLFVYIHSHCLPFLRIAAFIISQVTNLDVPSELSRSPPDDKPSCKLGAFHCLWEFLINVLPFPHTSTLGEFSLLVAYLGLPQSPSDLLVLLSDTNVDSESVVFSPAESSASSSLWLASLMTSWCLLGRESVARSLYTSQLVPSYLHTTSTLLPEPNIRLPHLIQLPKDYVSLMALATELKYVYISAFITVDCLTRSCNKLFSYISLDSVFWTYQRLPR